MENSLKEHSEEESNLEDESIHYPENTHDNSRNNE